MGNNPQKETEVAYAPVKVGNQDYVVVKPEALGIEGLPKDAVLVGMVGGYDRSIPGSYKEVIINTVSLDGKVDGLSSGKLTFPYESGHLKDGKLTLNADYVKNEIAEKLEKERRSAATQDETRETTDKPRGPDMSDKNLLSTVTGNTVKARLPDEQKKALGIPADATAYLMGTLGTDSKTAFKTLVVEQGDKSQKLSLSKAIAGERIGEGTLVDDQALGAMAKDESVRGQIAKALGITPQDPKAAGAEAGSAAGAGGDTTRGDTDPARGGTDAGREKPKGFMESAGEFANDNKMALGGGLMVGLLAAAMGSGGIMGLILGLLAAILIGGMLGMGKGGSEKAGGPEKPQPEKGKGLAIKKDGAPGPDTAIDVKEGERVQVVKEEDGVKKYLSGQDKDGTLTYSDSPKEITLRLQDKDGKITGLVTGTASHDSANFNVKETTSMLPDGRLSPNKGETFTQLTISKDGSVEMGGQALANARKPGADARDAFAKPQDIQLEVAADKSVKANLGEPTFKAGDKEAKGTVELQGRMSDDGKNVTFDKALFKDNNGNYALGANGKPIEVELPDENLKNLQVLAGNKVAPMSGDVENNKKGAAEGAVRKIAARVQADVSETQSMMDTLSSTDNKSAVISGKFNNKLQTLGAKDTEAALMAAEIADKYKDPEFLSKSAQERVSEVAGTFKSDTLDKLEAKAFAQNMDTAINGVRASDAVAAERTRSATESRENPVNYVELSESQRTKSILADLVDQKDYVTLPPAAEGPKAPTDVAGPVAGGAAPAPAGVARK